MMVLSALPGVYMGHPGGEAEPAMCRSSSRASSETPLLGHLFSSSSPPGVSYIYTGKILQNSSFDTHSSLLTHQSKMSQLASTSSSSRRNGLIATAQECLERFQTIRKGTLKSTNKASKHSRKYATNMTNFCDHMKLLLIENFIPDQKPEECARKQYDFIWVIDYLDRILLIKNNTFEREIYRKLLSVFIKIQESEGRFDVAKILSKSAKRRIQVSRITEKVNTAKEASSSQRAEMIEKAIREAEEAGDIRKAKKMYMDKSMLAVLTYYVKCSFGGEKLNLDDSIEYIDLEGKDLSDFEVVEEEKLEEKLDEEDNLLDFEVIRIED